MVVSRDRAPVPRLLTVVAPPAAEPAPGSRASVAAVRGLGCPVACGIFPNQGLNVRPLHWQVDS